jgi:hypothetical protein
MANWMKEDITFNLLGGKFEMNPASVSKKCWVQDIHELANQSRDWILNKCLLLIANVSDILCSVTLPTCFFTSSPHQCCVGCSKS